MLPRVKGEGSPYSTAEHRVQELIPVLGSQSAGDVVINPPGLQTVATLKRAATSFYRAMLCIRGTGHGPVSVCVCVCVI